MPPIRTRRACLAAALAAGALGLTASTTAAATSHLKVSSTAVTRAFSFFAAPNSKTQTLFNANGLLLNARCTSAGAPIVFAFSSGAGGDLLGRIFDGADRIHAIHNTSFDKRSKGVQINPSSNDFDSTGTLLYEDIGSRVVTVNIAMDNATTLGGRRVCTVYGSYVAS